MIPDNEWKELTSIETMGGSYGWLGIKILVAGQKLPDLTQQAIWKAASTARDSIQEELIAAIIAADPAAQESAKASRAAMLALFPGRIFVEEIPNGYGVDAFTRLLPWFVVTTEVGRFKIGWRRSVIAIDWTETRGCKTAEELFPNEDVTKGKQDIHAWNYEKAAEYIKAVMESANNARGGVTA